MIHTATDLHGNVPDSSHTALLLVDVINSLDWPGADQILPEAVAAARAIQTLKRRATEHGIPTIYVNDNFGKWQSNFQDLLRHCLEERCPGREATTLLQPDPQDYFVLKPRHSGFYETPLQLLLQHIGAHRLILGGLSTEMCILFTATDAYTRGYKLAIPTDCVASEDQNLKERALHLMRDALNADIRPADDIVLVPTT